MPDRDLATELRRLIRRQAYAIVALALVVVVAVVYFYWTLSSETDRTRSSLCTFLVDLEQRVQSSDDFLKDHPDGIPGVPAATLRASLKNQRATIASLAGLDCPAPPSKGSK